MQFRSVSVRTFQRTWYEMYPFITLGKSATDQCQTCQKFSVKLGQGGQMSDEEKCETLKNYEGHIDLKTERTLQGTVPRKKCNFLRIQNWWKT